MYSDKSFPLKPKEYNYLLPVLGSKLSNSSGLHYFTGDSEDLEDMLNRLKGLYDYYDDYDKIIIYRCHTQCSLKPFRDEVKRLLS